jgi:hypothetical protein
MDSSVTVLNTIIGNTPVCRPPPLLPVSGTGAWRILRGLEREVELEQPFNRFAIANVEQQYFAQSYSTDMSSRARGSPY